MERWTDIYLEDITSLLEKLDGKSLGDFVSSRNQTWGMILHPSVVFEGISRHVAVTHFRRNPDCLEEVVFNLKVDGAIIQGNISNGQHRESQTISLGSDYSTPSVFILTPVKFGLVEMTLDSDFNNGQSYRKRVILPTFPNVKSLETNPAIAKLDNILSGQNESTQSSTLLRVYQELMNPKYQCATNAIYRSMLRRSDPQLPALAFYVHHKMTNFPKLIEKADRLYKEVGPMIKKCGVWSI